MKKFLLTSCAILSVIGVQAQTTFIEGGVTYEAVQDGIPTKIGTGSDTVAIFSTRIVRNDGSTEYEMDIETIDTLRYLFNATAKKINNSASVNIYSFSKFTNGTRGAYVGSLADPQNYYDVGTPEYAAFFSNMSADTLNLHGIVTYNEMRNAPTATRYYYWTYDPVEKTWDKTQATGVDDANLNSVGYYQKLVSDAYTFYYLVRTVGIAKRTRTTVHRVDSCTVNAIAKNIAMNSTIQSISLGKDITSIAENAFMEDENLASFSVQNGGNFIYQNGILYDATKTNIIVASKDVTSQTIPNSVSYIYKGAFYNTANKITISSLNSNLQIGSNQEDNVEFIVPSVNLTVSSSGLDDGGWIVTGNVTQSNMNKVTIKGTYMDFRGATVLEDIDITNVGNTLLYFATTANVTGDKNIINNNVCANCVITDNANDKFYCPSKFTATNLSYSRQFDALWRTATFPFSTNDATVNDQILTGEFRGYMEDYHLFNFVYSQSIVANRPYIIKTESDDENASFSFENLSDVTVEVTNPMQVKQGPAYFYGNFDTQTLTSTDATFYYGITNTLNAQTGKYRSEVVKCVGATIKPFRAYLSGPATATANSARIRLVDAMDQVIDEIEMPMTTGIEDVKTEEAITDKVYNLNGQSVKASRGLNIINGKVVINK